MPKRKSTSAKVVVCRRSKRIKELKIREQLSINSETFDCQICMDSKPLNDIFHPNTPSNNPSTCVHPFCIGCISKHIDAKVQENISVIECPDVNCKMAIEFDSCINIIPMKVLDRWENVLSKSMIESSTSFYCPYKECSAPFLKEDGKFSKKVKANKTKEVKAKCPHCQEFLCTKCNVAWHEGMTCEEFDKLEDSEKAYEDVMLRNLVNKRNWVRCPRCKFYVERITGCSNMACRCGCLFCYGCGKKNKNGHQCSTPRGP